MVRNHETFLTEAIRLARNNLRNSANGPFGAVVVREGRIVSYGANRVVQGRDPTAHAEIEAIRNACRVLQTHELTGCDMYASCEPCPMCLGAIYWARIDRLYYGSSRVDATDAGFDDDLIYREIQKPLTERRLPMIQLMTEEADAVLAEWAAKVDRVLY